MTTEQPAPTTVGQVENDRRRDAIRRQAVARARSRPRPLVVPESYLADQRRLQQQGGLTRDP